MEPTTLYYVLAVLLVLVGIAGTILPALPGLPLVFAGMLLAAWAGDFQQVGVPMLVALGLLTVFSLAVDFWATALGAKRVGASKLAIIGAMVGAGLIIGISLVILALGRAVNPSITLLGVLGVVVAIALALLVVVMRGLLTKALQLEQDLSEVV